MPTCLNCGSHVSPGFMRTHFPEEVDDPGVCIHCPDEARAGFEDRAKQVSLNDSH